MIPLPQNTRKNGYSYVQVCRGKKAAIYSAWYKDRIAGYEVMMIRVRQKRKVKGVWLDAREKFPSNEDFGPYAKAIRSWVRAKELYDQAEKEKYNRFPVV